jgi:MFS family permease
MNAKRARKPRIFFGYWMAILCSLFSLLSFMGSLTTFAVFVRPLQQALSWDRTHIMTAFTITLAMFAVGGPAAGRLFDRFGPKKVMVPGAIIATIGLILLSRMTSLWEFYLGYCIVGIGSSATGPIASSWVVSHWFRKRRGLALGITSVGMSVGGALIVPTLAVYVMPALGWRLSYAILAAITCLVIVPLTLLVLRPKPSDLGLLPDGEKQTDNGTDQGNAVHLDSIPLKASVGTSAFWLIAVSLFFNHTHLGVMQSAFPHFCDMGFRLGAAATVASVTSVFTCTGMFTFGVLCDYIAPKFSAAIGLGFIATGICLMLVIAPSSPLVLLYVYAAVMGLGMGSWMPTMSMLTSSTFGLASYGAIFGMMTFFQNAGGGIGPLIAGYSFDATHSYNAGFVAILVMVLIAIPVTLAVPRIASKR